MAEPYVGDLHPELTEPMLVERFSPAGHIHSIRLCRDRKSGSSLGYVYIDVQHWADAPFGTADAVMWTQRDPTLRKASIGNLFIKNHDKRIASMAFYDTFSVSGKVLLCKVMRRGRKVHFESVEAALEMFNSKTSGSQSESYCQTLKMFDINNSIDKKKK